MAEKIQVSAEVAALRAVAFTDDPKFCRTNVTFEGATFEVRAPSIKQINDIERASTKGGKLDEFEQLSRTVIACTFAPGGEEPVFELGHIDQFRNRPATGLKIIKVLGEAIGRLVKASGIEDAEKNSESAPT